MDFELATNKPIKNQKKTGVFDENIFLVFQGIMKQNQLRVGLWSNNRDKNLSEEKKERS